MHAGGLFSSFGTFWNNKQILRSIAMNGLDGC